MRTLEAIDRLIEANKRINQSIVAKEVGIAESHLFNLIDDYPALGKLICNCKRRTIVESYSIVPDLPV
ncbi:MAG TPA: hypothetical protein VN665_03370 [Candidatus Paceibacterota bacterium]|nr:hypothetical protein [Candidatus Paceibacterota bacterium]